MRYLKPILKIFSKASLLLVGLLPLGDAVATELFISTSGDDANPGTRAKPFASLERGRDEARKLRQAGKASEGVTVFLQGDFFRTNALELTGADSGSPGAPVVWRSAEGASARLLGGRRVSGWKPVTRGAVWDRLATNARAAVVQADLHALGMMDFGSMKSRGFGRSTTPSHCELFFNGKPMTLARWPNEGAWELIDGFPETSGQNDDHGGKIGKLEAGFHLPRRPSTLVEGDVGHLGARLLGLGLGQLLRAGFHSRHRTAIAHHESPARTVWISQGTTILLPQRPGGTRPARRMVPGPCCRGSLFLAAGDFAEPIFTRRRRIYWNGRRCCRCWGSR